MNDHFDIIILRLSEDDGGGYIGLVPDLQGCMSDGETRLEAMANTEAAIAEYIELHERTGRNIPAPGTAMERTRKRQTALIEALKDMTSFAEDASAEVVTLREAIDRLLENINDGNWSSGSVSRVIAETKRSAALH